MSCRCDITDDQLFDSNGCFHCIETPRVKGRFGLAWVSESPDCPNPEPVGWQVEFHDTPSKVEQKCQEMVRWINCPPLPRCDPCPPDELCSPKNPPRCNPCAPMTNPCHPSCQNRSGANPTRQSSMTKRCCCCCGARNAKRCFPPPGTPYCRKRSPRRRNGADPKCTCDEVPVKDTNNSSSGDYKHDTSNNKYNNNSNSPKQVTTAEAECVCSKETVTLYRNDQSGHNTDTENLRSCMASGCGGNADDDDKSRAQNEERELRNERLDGDDKAAVKESHRGVRHEVEVHQVRLQADGYPHGCRDCCDNYTKKQQAQSPNDDCYCYADERDKARNKQKESKVTTIQEEPEDIGSKPSEKSHKSHKSLRDEDSIKDKGSKHKKDTHSKERDSKDTISRDKSTEKHSRDAISRDKSREKHTEHDSEAIHRDKSAEKHKEKESKDAMRREKSEEKHKAKEHEHDETQPINAPNYHHHDQRYHTSVDSLDQALMKMAAPKAVHSHRSRHEDDTDYGYEEELQQSRAATVHAGRSRHSPDRDGHTDDKEKSGSKHKSRHKPSWLNPLIHLCFKSKDTKSDHDHHKRRKSKSPRRKSKSPKSPRRHNPNRTVEDSPESQ